MFCRLFQSRSNLYRYFILSEFLSYDDKREFVMRDGMEIYVRNILVILLYCDKKPEMDIHLTT